MYENVPYVHECFYLLVDVDLDLLRALVVFEEVLNADEMKGVPLPDEVEYEEGEVLKVCKVELVLLD